MADLSYHGQVEHFEQEFSIKAKRFWVSEKIVEKGVSHRNVTYACSANVDCLSEYKGF